MVSQSSGGNKKGKVSLQKLDDYLQYKNKKGVKMFATMSPIYEKLNKSVGTAQAAPMTDPNQISAMTAPALEIAQATTQPGVQAATESLSGNSPAVMTETTPMTPQAPNLQGMIGQITNMPIMDLIKNPQGALDGLKQQLFGAFSGTGQEGLASIIQNFSPDGIKDKLKNVFGQVKEGFVGQLKQINLSNVFNLNGLMSSFGNIFKTGLGGIGNIFSGLLGGLGGKGGIGGMLGGLLGGEKSGGIGGMLSGVLGGGSSDGGIGGMLGGIFGGGESAKGSSGGGIGDMLGGLFGGGAEAKSPLGGLATVFNPSSTNSTSSSFFDTIGSTFSSVSDSFNLDGMFGGATEPMPLLAGVGASPMPTFSDNLPDFAPQTEPIATTATPIPSVQPESTPQAQGSSNAPITVNITVNVSGGGEGDKNKFDPMALAQQIREQVELGLADAHRSSIHDID